MNNRGEAVSEDSSCADGSKPVVRLLPRFLGVEGARYFTLQFAPAGFPKAHIVFVPPFAEEMNRCRSMVADQARSFAESGYACTLVDFYGTGDSEGELRGARLAMWHDNLRHTIELLQREAPAPLVLWGLRLGALIAMDYASMSPIPVRDIILWQPVSSAKLYITQVLRQRVAALMVRGLPAETTSEIRQKLNLGELVEVAGYTLAGELLHDLEEIDNKSGAKLCTGKIHWLEHVLVDGKEVGIASQKAIDKLIGQGNRVAVYTFTGPPIWMIHERDAAPNLLALTGTLLP